MLLIDATPVTLILFAADVRLIPDDIAFRAAYTPCHAA